MALNVTGLDDLLEPQSLADGAPRHIISGMTLGKRFPEAAPWHTIHPAILDPEGNNGLTSPDIRKQLQRFKNH